MNKIWRVWAKALGEKASECDKESDVVAIIRTIIFITYLITNIAIVANAVRHWNDVVNSNSSQGHTTHTEGSNVSGTRTQH